MCQSESLAKKRKPDPDNHESSSKQEQDTPTFPEPKGEEMPAELRAVIEEFRADTTYYELTPRSDDEDSDVDANYDSVFFSETEQGANPPQPPVTDRPKTPQRPGEKRVVTFKHKEIARWAENKGKLNAVLVHQNARVQADCIFGRLTSDCVNLGEIFGPRRRYEKRDSSANWKNEYWTPDTVDRCQQHYRGQAPVESFMQRLEKTRGEVEPLQEELGELEGSENN